MHTCKVAIAMGLFVFSLYLKSVVSMAQPRAGSCLEVGTETQLFIDNRFIESSENIALNMSKPILTQTDIFPFQNPWEEGGISYAQVLEDQGILKLWYESHEWDPNRKRQLGHFICYATSRDGIQWEKPSLGIIEYRGSRKNNIVMAGAHEGSFFIDPMARAEQRYKYIGHVDPDPLWEESKGAKFSMYICYSADGTHWKRGKESVFPFYCDTQNQAFWDARIQKYVAYLRSWNPLRTVSRVEVEDITQPWPYDKTVKPFYLWGEDESHPPALTTQFPIVFAYDERDPVISDHYNLCVLPYAYAQDVYLGFPSAYLHYDGVPLKLKNSLQKLAVTKGNDGLLDIQLAVSRNGINWMRPDRKPYIGLGLPGSGRASSLYMLPSLIRKGDELWLYYKSGDMTHGGRDRSQGFGPEPEGQENYRKENFITRVVVPLHRFISATSAWEGGSLTTPLLRFTGSKLELNIDTSALGLARVAILDNAGQKIEGYSLQDCDPINGNFLHHIVSWNGKADLSTLKGKVVRLRFVSRSTDLYAFRFAP